MAFLEELQFTGSLGDLSFYRMRGTDKIVVRRKGGASKEAIKKSPNFALPRLYMSEFGGCSTMGKEVRFMMHPMRALADYNFSGFINKSLKLIQKQDSTSKLGQRAIELSKHPKLLEGFQLNKYTTFDSMVRSTLSWSIDEEKGSAKVEIPALVRDINFFPNNRHSKFSITISLGVVPDFKFNQATGKFTAPKWYDTMYGCDYTSSEWHSALKGSPATTLELSLDQLPPDGGYSLMLGIGICFGDSLDAGEVKQIKRAGAAKILGIVAGKAQDADLAMDDTMNDNTQDVAPVDICPAPVETTPQRTTTSQGPTQRHLRAVPPLSCDPEPIHPLREETRIPAVRSYMYHYTVTGVTSTKLNAGITYWYTIPSDVGDYPLYSVNMEKVLVMPGTMTSV
ncbi:hypothetical protein KK062_17055 [Fulvivirgaceae bacterium PWU5]|uniref:Uncharacterized protein n=1 Tax=Dawidia cretensis TaxID=2782350 RepID=A0AAP2E1L3_9BACT|nr:hypothetical protein [Dawidia cretensis]MBT1709957.1 hypothetical protein [Dawidia cretensis]